LSNVGYATLSVIPSLKGGGAALASQMSGPASVAGSQAGGLFGGAFSGILAGGALVAGLGAGLAAVGSSFDEAYDHIRTETGATGAELEGLKDVFRGVVADVPTDFGTAADAISSLQQRLHLTGGNLEGLSEQMLELSRITETDLGQNVDSVTRLFGDWGISTDDMGERLDQLFRASQISGVGVDELASNVTNFGSPLRQLGFDLTDSLALFSRFSAEGVNTSTVMSGMRQAVKNLGSGFATEQTGVRNFQDVIAGVKDGTFDLQDAFSVFGARAAPDMFAAIQDGRFDLEQFSDQISLGRDTILGAAADTNDWRESLELLKNKGMLLLEPVATRVFDALGKGAQFVLRLTRVFDRRGLSGALEFVKRKFDELSPAVKIVGAAILGFISPLSLVAAGAIYAYTHFEGFRRVVDSVARWLVGTAWPAIQQFALGLRTAFVNAVAFVTSLWRQFGDEITAVASGLWQGISRTVRNGLNVIMGIWNFWAGVFSGDWSRVWKAIKQFVGAIWNQVTNIFRNGGKIWLNIMKVALNLLGRAVQAGLQVVQAWFRALPGRVLSLLARLPGLLMNLGRAALRAMREGITAAWDNVREFFASIPRRALTAIGDLGRLLYDKGRDLVQGLIDGIQSKLSALGGVLDQLTTGLNPFDESTRQLAAGIDVPVTLTPTIGSIPAVSPIVPGNGASALERAVVSTQSIAERSVIRFEFDGPDELVRFMQKSIRVRGGAKAVFG
jgi:TP901 family phage tail tape measure protein